MDAYKEWRKKVFDVAKEKFADICNINKDITKISDDCIIIDDTAGFEDRYAVEGICSYKTEYFEKFSYPDHACLTGTTMPSMTFRTSYLTEKKATLDKIMVAFAGTGIFYKKFAHFFEITIEGIKVSYIPEKKVLFMNNGYDNDKSQVCYATFKSMAEKGYEISSASAYLKVKTFPKDKYAGWQVKEKVHIWNPLRWYLGDTLPKLINLYKENMDLYEDALDDICE